MSLLQLVPQPWSSLLPIIFIAIPLLSWLIRKGMIRAHRSIQRWADENGYILVSKKLSWTRLFRKGPYRWASKNQMVFRVVVIDQQKMGRSGWVRCGSYFKGAAFTDVVVGVLDSKPLSSESRWSHL
jgi:hypothetical protein